ncbi:11520_t:CDS:2 [Funneliformis geosporum]|uniref:11520_t:CDS:1 n=1 Tax=Funneliformis geosporum TaxID=1117311 RepID=A0A9W4SUY0_9GLOM|nr:11520_t:CDS:2 [Funneliformis geosporum]
MAAIYYCKICEKLIVDEDELPTVGTYCSKKCEKIFEKFGREKVRKDRLSVHDDDDVEVPLSSEIRNLPAEFAPDNGEVKNPDRKQIKKKLSDRDNRNSSNNEDKSSKPSMFANMFNRNKRDGTEEEMRSGKNDRKSLIDALPYDDSVGFFRKQGDLDSAGNTRRERSRSRVEEPSNENTIQYNNINHLNNPATIDTTTHTPIYSPAITPTPTIIASPTPINTTLTATTTTPIVQKQLSTSSSSPPPPVAAVENQSQTVPTHQLYPEVKQDKHTENYIYEDDNTYDEPPPAYESICPNPLPLTARPINPLIPPKLPPKLPPKVPISMNTPPLMNQRPHLQPPNQFFPHNNQQRPFFPTINQQNISNIYGRSSSCPQHQPPLNVYNFGVNHSHPSTSSTSADRFLSEQANLPSTVYPPPFYTIKKFGNNT